FGPNLNALSDVKSIVDSDSDVDSTIVSDVESAYQAGKSAHKTVIVPLSAAASLRLTQCQQSRKACNRHIHDFALAQGKRAIIDRKRSGGARFRYVCNSKTPCTFFVCAYRSSMTQSFWIVGSVRATAAQVLSTSATVAAVSAFPQIPAKARQHQVQAIEGYKVHTRMLYRVKEQLVASLHGKNKEGFQKLESLLQRFCEKNATAHYASDFDADSRFRRCFLSHPFAAKLQLSLQDVLEFDGSFMKQLFAAHCWTAGIVFSGKPLFTDRGAANPTFFDPASWAPHLGNVRRYGWRTTNFVESENSVVVPKRHLPPYDVFEAVTEKFMTDVHTRQVCVAKWVASGRATTPHAQALFEVQQRQAGFLTVIPSSRVVFFVHDPRNQLIIRRRVDLDARTCTYPFTDQMGIPCNHLIAAFNLIGRQGDIIACFDRCYHVAQIAKALEGASVELTLHEEIALTTTALPPVEVKRVGRRRVKRLPLQGEDTVKPRSKRVCSVCRETGHNQRMCSN
ncbi:TPA: hypothetical protein N0F65_010712, partial [Lagenidium giganteum]